MMRSDSLEADCICADMAIERGLVDTSRARGDCETRARRSAKTVARAIKRAGKWCGVGYGSVRAAFSANMHAEAAIDSMCKAIINMS